MSRSFVTSLLAIAALLGAAWTVGTVAGGALASSAAAPPVRSEERVRIEPTSPMSEGVPVVSTEVEAEVPAEVESEVPGETPMPVADDGSVTAEQQCRAIEVEVSLRWDDGRMTDDDYSRRYEGFLTDEEYETILVPSFGAPADVAGPSERPVFGGFADVFVVENLDNDELIIGYDNCWQLELYDFG